MLSHVDGHAGHSFAALLPLLSIRISIPFMDEKHEVLFTKDLSDHPGSISIASMLGTVENHCHFQHKTICGIS